MFHGFCLFIIGCSNLIEVFSYPYNQNLDYENRPGQKNKRSRTRVVCHSEYKTVWDTQYTELEAEECAMVYEDVCRTLTKRSCVTVPKRLCQAVDIGPSQTCQTNAKDVVCTMRNRTEYVMRTETICSTDYREDCEYRWEGEGNTKVWSPIPGTCITNPYHTCVDKPKRVQQTVAVPICKKIHQKACSPPLEPLCKTVQRQECKEVPYKQCNKEPREVCERVHRKIPARTSKRIPIKVCRDEPGTAEQGPKVLEEIIDEKSKDAIVFPDKTSVETLF